MLIHTNKYMQVVVHCLKHSSLHLAFTSHESDDSRTAFEESLRKVFLVWEVVLVQRALSYTL